VCGGGLHCTILKQIKMSKKAFKINGSIIKLDGSKLTKKEKKGIYKSFIKFVEDSKLGFIGITD